MDTLYDLMRPIGPQVLDSTVIIISNNNMTPDKNEKVSVFWMDDMFFG